MLFLDEGKTLKFYGERIGSDPTPFSTTNLTVKIRVGLVPCDVSAKTLDGRTRSHYKNWRTGTQTCTHQKFCACRHVTNIAMKQILNNELC